MTELRDHREKPETLALSVPAAPQAYKDPSASLVRRASRVKEVRSELQEPRVHKEKLATQALSVQPVRLATLALLVLQVLLV